MKEMKNKTKIIIGTIIILIAGFVSYKVINNAIPGETIYISVSQGDSVSEVADQVVAKGAKVSYDRLYKEFIKQEATIYPNDYEINTKMSAKEIVSILSNPQSNITGENLVIIEGDNIENVANNVASKSNNRFSKEEVLAYWDNKDTLNTLIDKYWFLDETLLDENIIHPLEGYFAPATYTLTPDYTIEELTTKFLAAMETNLEPYKEASSRNDLTINQMVTLASIVERETMTKEDKYKVAGVFYNRLEQGMPLQSDITVLYALGEHKEIVTYEDLEVDSLYNTYKYTGIPIAPVAMVSKDSLEAVANPQDNDYLYFFAKQHTGEIIYSKTLEEHKKVSEENAWE